ncbi:PREDICTED: MOG interacting and ectopic P-granules protein 1 isoform X2 [Nicrophorus vespilloides]|uniref:MOG interacting and ectopic P-granules protein 1 isoform X2 n=1 Tax=Nicrophorus vespilloides TaxID=110193 RepID=A0ABM1MFC7_NICVS|nr:PREDICTED: MOG interacting and ectopic P-granules protein 1 isoform X2 [Nicrophorus vespilloides]
MAAAVEMGEVDDIHIKDDNVTEGVVMNGDIGEGEKRTVVEEKSDVEVMEVDEPEDEPEVEEEPEKEDEEEIVENASTEDTANSVSDENSQDMTTQEEEDGEHKEEEEEAAAAAEEVEEPELDKMDEDDNNSHQEEEEEEEEVDSHRAEVDESAEQEDDITVIECNEDGDKEQADDEVEEVVDEVHAVDDNSDDDVVQITKEEVTHVTPVKDSASTKIVVLNDSNEVDDIMIVDSDVKENGTSTPEKPEVIDLDCTPVKKTPTSGKPASVTPRRSSRNLHKSKTYVDMRDTPSDESDIEEVIPQDPLADTLHQQQQQHHHHHHQSDKPKKRASSTIVVKDTKRLVEIASKSSPSNSGKKEPTLVIIDTNSILSGRGPVPISQKSSGQSSYSNLPVALPAQGVYPPNMRATITPIPMTTSTQKTTTTSSSSSVTMVAQQPPILPSLTDDMFVVEAPSFIVPYVYEKPPVKNLKDSIKTIADEIKRMLEEEEKKERENGEDKDDDIEEVPIVEDKKDEDKTKRHTYFDSPIGKFFVDIGNSLVQEYVQTDLLKQQKRKREREGGQNSATMKTIQSLLKSLEYTKENNQPYKMVMKKCEFCSYKTESSLAMAFHLETPHMKNFVYRCNFCAYEVRSPHDILYHMEGEHCVRGRLERAPAFHQCPNCPFEDNQKGKLSRHSVACARKFKPERNLEPPIDWEPPAKIPRAPRMKQQQSLTTTAAMYQAMAKNSSMNYMKMQQQQQQQASIVQQTAMNRGRGRPSLPMPSKKQSQGSPQGLVYKQAVPGGASVLVPTNYQISGNQLYQVVGGQDMGNRLGGPMGIVPSLSSTSGTISIQNSSSKSKTVHQPSISITPLPRPTGGSGSSASSLSNSSLPGVAGAKPGDSNSKNSFVICEICDGYIKDLEQLRNHMQWIHKVKIHPKMIYNRPPLNCQKCQFRFFTDQGLERHLLGSHGLVTSSMQEAANKCKDSGRCPVCGRVYQWKLLNHVARDHSMTLKPAHLSYKCTVCTATFGMYKQFENHVYSAHSVVAKRSNDKKPVNSSPPSSKGESLLKPLKINDEITIIPQMPKSNGAGSSKDGHASTSKNTPSTSKIGDASITRAERLARRKTSLVGDNN